MVTLTQIDLLHGIFSLFYPIICFIIGFKILSKYFRYKQKEMLSFGITWIFLCSSWWGGALSFLTFIFSGTTFDLFLLLFFGELFFPFTVIFWIYTFSHLMYPAAKNKILLVYLMIVIPYEIFLVFTIFTNPELIASIDGAFSIQYTLFGTAFQGFMYLTAVTTGLLFVKKSLKNEDQIIQWKGRFILIAIITFTIAAVFQILFPKDPILIIINYILLIISVIGFYVGFLLPKRISAWLLKLKE